MNISSDRTLAERAYTAIHAAIVSGEYAPGDRLRIEELSASLHLSPTPIREALHRLESDGLAERVPHRGARVTELSPEDLRELYEARLELEPFAACKAAARFTEAMAKAARTCLNRQLDAERSNDFPEAWKAHTAFHFTLYEASGSRWLLRLITPLWESSQRYRMRAAPLRGGRDLRNRDGEHLSILEACVSRDTSRVATELYNHLARTANQVAVQMTGEILFELKSSPEK